MDRRTALGWMVAASASVPLWDRAAFSLAASRAPSGAGYGTDPDLLRVYASGELWPLTFTAQQRALATALCALIIPADEKSASAADLGVQDFIDEWISAPYPAHRADRKLVLEGFAWLDAQAAARFGAGSKFASLGLAQQTAICDDICFAPKAQARFSNAARFFARYRDLTAGGFYTTPAGRRDVGYIGNVALATFDLPPAAALKQVGLDEHGK